MFEELPLEEPAKPSRPVKSAKAAKLSLAKPATKRSAKHELPEDWLPNEAGVAYARSLRLTDEQIAGAVEKFRNHHRSHANKRVDWDAAWRVWVQNEIEFAKSSPRSAGRRSGRSLSERLGV